jgi:hypothetical protein
MDIKKIKNSFKAVKRDFDVLRVSFADWINHLRFNQELMQKRIDALESRVKELEENSRILVATY